jgi:8-oxo-dGTP diphosphatase / 2-hydroxy-dATP diphosphatase
MRSVNLIYCLKDNLVLLGLKKRGFGVNKLNGYGGKPDANETIEQAAVRELKEEAGVTSDVSNYEKVAEIDFIFADVPVEKNWNQTVHVYFLRKWVGEPVETEEMKPVWADIKQLPFDKMWLDDKYWLSDAIAGKKIKAEFVFGKSGAEILEFKIKYVNGF